MSKHHLENLAEQLANKGYASSPFHYGKIAIDRPVVEDSIQLRAYKIHQEKGGSELDNWLEAELSIKKDLTMLINEGNPSQHLIKDFNE